MTKNDEIERGVGTILVIIILILFVVFFNMGHTNGLQEACDMTCKANNSYDGFWHKKIHMCVCREVLAEIEAK